jgi:hypothetical protein
MRFFDKIIEERMQTRQILNETDVKMKGLRVNPGVLSCFPDGFNCSQYAMDKMTEQYLEASTNRRYYAVEQPKDSPDPNESDQTIITIKLKGGFLRESNVRSLKKQSIFNGERTEQFIPVKCDCAWYGNWRLPCKHMFMIAASEVGSHLPSDLIHPRWNVLTQLEVLHLHSFNTPMVTYEDDPPDVREKKRAYADLYADFRAASSVATTLNQEQELRGMLQNYVAVATGSMKRKEVAKSVTSSITNSNPPTQTTSSNVKENPVTADGPSSSLVSNNPIVPAKRKRKRKSKGDIESLIALPTKGTSKSSRNKRK